MSLHLNQQTMATNATDNINELNGTEYIEEKEEEAMTMPANMRGSSNDSTNLELLDPSIMADRETSMHVTTWIRANYVREREHNVPRRNMFEHYKIDCTSQDLTPVNSATFGKLLRVVFPDLKTRRLGVRGQSKYHYCGIRVRTPEDGAILIGRSVQNSPMAYSASASTSASASGSVPPSPSVVSAAPTFITSTFTSVSLNRSETDNDLLASFTLTYERHCKEIFRFISNNQLDKVRESMEIFYNGMPEHFVQLIQNTPEVTDAVWRWDCSLYDAMITTFLPSINHKLPAETVRTLRTYTRELRDYIQSNLSRFPIPFYQKKADVARIFCAKFRRQLSLNFAAQTAATVLSMPDHVAIMRQDWERFDFDGILDQTLWVCECDNSEIRNILRQDIYELLTSKPGIEHWMKWVSTLVHRYLKAHTPTSINDANHYLARSKQILLKWTFYTSLIMKDLTLQQARSFGSFHNLRLFLDDYILYLVEENIAQVNYTLMQQQMNEVSSRVGAYFSESPIATTSDRNLK
ncbi:hypothetical protein HPULCUR_002330 [Helicostylum pulchrum]|uniref:RFX-type winged-helix domain-containing protein n=1 Tax=Helicostylum pulchrum TaxID=562976 RepID=A0ABP9XQA4_9FUNG